MSAQRSSALFPLSLFCSVAYRQFKFLAWQVCLDFLFDKNRFYENVWDCALFYLVLKRLGIFFYFLQKFKFF